MNQHPNPAQGTAFRSIRAFGRAPLEANDINAMIAFLPVFVRLFLLKHDPALRNYGGAQESSAATTSPFKSDHKDARWEVFTYQIWD
jgi:hypothetical protein